MQRRIFSNTILPFWNYSSLKHPSEFWQHLKNNLNTEFNSSKLKNSINIIAQEKRVSAKTSRRNQPQQEIKRMARTLSRFCIFFSFTAVRIYRNLIQSVLKKSIKNLMTFRMEIKPKFK